MSEQILSYADFSILISFPEWVIDSLSVCSQSEVWLGLKVNLKFAQYNCNIRSLDFNVEVTKPYFCNSF